MPATPVPSVLSTDTTLAALICNTMKNFKYSMKTEYPKVGLLSDFKTVDFSMRWGMLMLGELIANKDRLKQRVRAFDKNLDSYKALPQDEEKKLIRFIHDFQAIFHAFMDNVRYQIKMKADLPHEDPVLMELRAFKAELDSIYWQVYRSARDLNRVITRVNEERKKESEEVRKKLALEKGEELKDGEEGVELDMDETNRYTVVVEWKQPLANPEFATFGARPDVVDFGSPA